MKHQIKNRQFKTAEKECKSGQKVRKIKGFQTHRATPKPWVAPLRFAYELRSCANSGILLPLPRKKGSIINVGVKPTDIAKKM